MRILLLLALGLVLSTSEVHTSRAAGAAAPVATSLAGSGPAVPDGPADEPPASLPFSPTVDDVLAWMAQIPESEFRTKPYPRWAKTGAANRIAKAIADHAESREDAVDLAIYACFESGLLLSAAGDGGKSHGPWQISEDHATPSVASDPDQAAVLWLGMAKKSRIDCAKLPEDEQLAELGSGSCDRGRSLARRRARLRDRILADVVAEP
jgi:hypothetical protein